ncbi:MAG: MGMT family protein [Candidatus Levybacteria bacterium]|nr:MGMT family protein [Candidatus Levybacteria bacterium]
MKPFDFVYQIVASIPKGKVSTYGQVAKMAGVTARIVGFAMHANKNPKIIPCHRVVSKNGELTGYAFGGTAKKKELLEREGVKFLSKEKVDIEQSLYQF